MTTTARLSQPTAQAYAATPAPPAVRTRTPRSPAWLADVTVMVLLAGGVFVVALWLTGGGLQDIEVGGADALTSVGRLTGLLSAKLLLDQVLLMARVPVIERSVGQDRLIRWHKWIGFTSFWGMCAHIVLITLGYAGGLGAASRTLVDLVLEYPGMLLATAGTLALVMVVVTSINRARRRLRYESWHLLHLYAYLGAFLPLPHQLWTGRDFLASPAATTFWWGLWIAAAVSTVLFRLGLPLVRSLRHDLRVESVRPAGAGATTVRVTGRAMDRMPVRAGQFFNWRFLDGPGWTRANPYSISAAPDGRGLEITVAPVGDGSARLANVRPGTKVLVEGPYGRLHPGVAETEHATLVGCGVGIAPLKAVAEGLVGSVRSLTIVYRCHSLEDAPLLGELDAFAGRVGARLVIIDGRRSTARVTWLPARLEHRTDEDVLAAIEPGIAEHDVYVCGPRPWARKFRATCTALGVPARRFHAESFGY